MINNIEPKEKCDGVDCKPKIKKTCVRSLIKSCITIYPEFQGKHCRHFIKLVKRKSQSKRR